MLSALSDNSRYCLFLDIPKSWYAKADYTLAGLFSGNFLWNWYRGFDLHTFSTTIYDVCTIIGAVLGLFIVGIRAWKTWKFRKHKD